MHCAKIALAWCRPGWEVAYRGPNWPVYSSVNRGILSATTYKTSLDSSNFARKCLILLAFGLRVSTKVFKSVNMSPNDKKDVLKNSGVQKKDPKIFLWNLNTYVKRMQHRHTFCLNRKFIFWKYHSQSLIHIKFLK